MMRARQRQGQGSVLAYAVLIFVSIVILFPLLNIVLVSLSEKKALSRDYLSVFYQPTLTNYPEAVAKGHMVQYFFNTLIVMAIALVIIMLSASLCAYAIKRFHYRAVNFSYYLLLSGMFIPVQAVILPLFRTLKIMGLVNSHFGLAIVYAGMSLPLAMMMFTGFFRSIPNELIEAGTIDGCGILRTFFAIILPLSKTIISTVIILSGLQIWRDFFLPLVLITTAAKKTLAIGLLAFVNEFSLDWTRMCAAMVMQTLPIMVLFLSLQKYFVEGVVAGAVKG